MCLSKYFRRNKNFIGFFLSIFLAAAFYLANIASPVGLAPATSPNTDGQVRTYIIGTKDYGTRQVTARPAASGKHTRIWVDVSEPIPNEVLSSLLTNFERNIYPKNIKYFANANAKKEAGQVDILVTELGGNLDGYFDSGNLTKQDRSNLIYLDSDVVRNEPVEANNTLAHEFAHLLYYLSGGANIEWLDEGLAVYAECINGNRPSLYIDGFRQNPNVKLTGDFTRGNNAYGAAFLFIASATEQVDQSNNPVPEFIHALIKNSNQGMSGINKTLARFITNPSQNSFDKIYQPRQLAAYASNLTQLSPAKMVIPMLWFAALLPAPVQLLW